MAAFVVMAMDCIFGLRRISWIVEDLLTTQ